MSKMTLFLNATRQWLQGAVRSLSERVPPGLRSLTEAPQQGAEEETDYVDLLGFSSKNDRGTA